MSDTQAFKKETVSARLCQLSQPDIETLVSYVEKKAVSARLRGTKRGVIDELLVLVLVHTGVRVRELCEFNIGDLSISENGVSSINVRSNPPRRLPVPVDLYEKFKKYTTYYRQKNDAESPLIVSEQGNRISYQNVYLKIKSIGKKAGLDNLHPYMIRHYFLCQLYEKEHDLTLVQNVGGYLDTKTAASSLNLMN